MLDTTALFPLWVKHGGYRLLGPATILEPPRDGRMLDPQEVKDAFVEINTRNPIERVAMDDQGRGPALWLENELGVEVVDRSYSGASQVPLEDYDAFTEGLREGRLKHTGDLGLRRHV